MSEEGKVPTRRGQIGGGFVSGLKKGTLQGLSKRAAKSAADVLPIKGEAAEGVAQFAILSLAAELAEKVPTGVGSKIGLTDERKFGFGEACRNLAGENSGRHLVEIMTNLAPHLADVFSKLSTKDILDATTSLKQESEQQQAEAQASGIPTGGPTAGETQV